MPHPYWARNFTPRSALADVMADWFWASAFLGTAMPLGLTWPDMIVRLGCTLIAGALIGFNRSEHGKAAGLRTTILVCLAAAIAMLQMNYLLPLAGRATNSFVTNDLMRLPLGILTGVGFIGGGAILRRGNLVIGVTTAATLWYVTVIGLCFGGGQMLLGWAATAVGLFVLWGLAWLESLLTVRRQVRLSVTIAPGGPSEDELRRRLGDAGMTVRDVGLSAAGELRTYTFELRETRRPSDSTLPAVIKNLTVEPGISSLKWRYFE